MEYVNDDGGRGAAGYKGQTGDCTTRAIAIATGKPYQEVYDVQVSKHLVAVIDGVIHDTYDPSRDGTRCVYGYWKKGN